MIERLDFSDNTMYDAAEAAIHLNRYSITKPYVLGKKVLDVSCGDGYGSFLLKQWGAAEVQALDIDSSTIEKAISIFGSEGIFFTCGNAEELPYDDYSFDVICSFETIEHLDHPELFLAEVKRVLKPGGIVIISCPNDPYYHRSGTPNNPFHKRTYTFLEFKTESERYLGTDVKYLLAFALNGFVNIPIEYQTLPPDDDGIETIPKDMFALFNYKSAVGSMVPGERFLNNWNACYYVGIWHSTDFPSINTVFYPRETFTDYSRDEIESYLAATGIGSDSRDAIPKIQEDIFDLKRDKHVLGLEIQRLSLLLELETKEKDLAYEQVRGLYDHNQLLNNELQQLKESANATSLELQRTSLMMELENKTSAPYQVAMSRRQLWKELIKTSRLFNFARRFRVVKWLVWHIFKRQI